MIPRQQLALSGHHFTGVSPGDLASMMSRLGIGALDAWPWNIEATGARETLQDSEIEIAAVNVPSSVAPLAHPGNETQVQEACFAAIELAASMDCDLVQMYTATPPVGSQIAGAHQLAASLSPLAERAQEAGVRLVIENNLDQRREDVLGVNPSRSADSLSLALTELDAPNVGVAFDPCNFVAVGHEPFPTSYEVLKKWILAVHFKDCVRYSPALHSRAASGKNLLVDTHGGAFLPVPVGKGSVPWLEIINRLVADGYEGWLTLDPFVSRSDLDSWCTESMSWLACSWPAQAA